MAIPEHLKDLPIWTLSDTDKCPLDIHHLYTTGAEKLYSPTRGSKLYTYKAAKKVQRKKPHTLLTIRPRAEDNITLLDIEPEGVKIDPNPYMKMKVDYMESSMSGGIHGIILDTIEDVQDIFKDEQFQTELFKNNHFMIITENEIDPPVPPEFTLQDYAQRIKDVSPKLSELEYAYSPDDSSHEIDEDTKTAIRKIFVRPFKNDSKDASRNEYRYGVYLSGLLMRKLKPAKLNTLISHVLYMAEFHLPYRDKHKRRANYTDYGNLSWREYTLIQGAEYIFNKEIDK